MKRFSYYLQILILALLFIVHGCKKKVVGPTENLSKISTMPLGTSNTIIPYYTIDKSGKYAYFFIRDLEYNFALIKKINLETLASEASITIPGTVPISPDNIVVTDDNQLLSTFYNFSSSSMLILKFDADLNIVKYHTVANVPGGNYGRTRLVKNGPGKITGAYSNQTSGGKCYLSYQNMDEDLNILNQVTDSSNDYGSQLMSGTNFIKTSDNGYLYTADNYDMPFGNCEVLLEKRDANFKLLWRVKYKPLPSLEASPRTLNEYNGKYYVYCCYENVSTFVLTYDLNGNLIQNIPLETDGAVLNNFEPMRLTENGEFLILSGTKLNASPNQLKGILFRTDANLKVLSTEVFGGKGVSGGMLKINADKYLHFYTDNSYIPDNNLSRLVLRYIDAKGNIIN